MYIYEYVYIILMKPAWSGKCSVGGIAPNTAFIFVATP